MTEYFQRLKISLLVYPIIKLFTIIREKAGDKDGYIRIRCELLNNDIFEFSLYVEKKEDTFSIENYTYHWQARDGRLKYRWDNTPHHPEISTFPDHVHREDDNVEESKIREVSGILKFIEQTMKNT